MSVNALNSSISAARADGHITAEEAKTLTSPEVLGAFTDKDEFEVFKRLAADVKIGNKLKEVTPEIVKEVNDKNKARLVHKGVKIGAGIGSGLGVAGIIGSVAVVAALAGPAGFLVGFPALGVAIAVAGLTIGIGALAGYIHSRRNPITASEIKRKSPLALAAAQFKKNPLVKRGVKIGGIIGGVLSGLGVVPVGFIALVGGVYSGSVVVLFAGAPAAVLGVLGGTVCLLIGLGALGGYIHSKVKGHNHGNPVTADPEAVTLIEETVQKGVTGL